MKHRVLGFTLLEWLISLCIGALLLMATVSGWKVYRVRLYEAQAHAALIENSLSLERWRVQWGDYFNKRDRTDIEWAPLAVTSHGEYRFELSGLPETHKISGHYRLWAIPNEQAKKEGAHYLLLTQDGRLEKCLHADFVRSWCRIRPY